MLPVTTALLGANIAAYLLQSLIPGLIVPFALWPFAASAADPSVGFEPWQLVTYGFLHGGFMHLAFNMFALYMFGNAIEQLFGARRYLLYYFVCVISAGVTQLLVSAMSGTIYPTIGASGGVFGLLLAYGLYFPNTRLMLLFPPIPMRARVFVILYAVIELVLGVTGSEEGVAHFAHLGGMIGGYAL